MANNIMYYDSPIGRMVLVSDGEGLCGVYFVGQKYDRAGVDDVIEQEDEYLLDAKRWLDIYFQGKVPDFLPNLHMIGSEFQMEVWSQLLQIPYGQTTTYGSIASHCKKEHMSAQAVGGAVGRNKISIIVPCHRVIGSNGSLTGYASGLDKKKQLLRLEGIKNKEIPVKY